MFRCQVVTMGTRVGRPRCSNWVFVWVPLMVRINIITGACLQHSQVQSVEPCPASSVGS